MFSDRQRVARMRRLAVRALDAYRPVSCGSGGTGRRSSATRWSTGESADFRSALIDGCTRHRPLPPGGLAHLDDFIAAREVAFGLWFTGTAQVNPVFRAQLGQLQADIGRSLDTLSRN